MLQLIVLLLGTVVAQQGQAFRLTVPHEAGIQGVEATWQGRRIPYVLIDGQWVAVAGVDLDVAAGAHPAQVEVRRNGAVERLDVTVEVRAVSFPTTRLTVAEQYVELSPENAERAGREAAEIQAIHDRITGERLWREPFLSPIEGAASSNFGHRRVFNDEPRAPHTGADLRAATGTPVRSTNRGRVVLSKDLFFTGNTVIVDHGLGVYSLYAHLSRLDVQNGATVERGQVLGLAGATGRVTGPHLHWGVRVVNARVDPYSLIELGR